MPADFLPIISFTSTGTLPRKHHQSGRLSPNSNPTTRSDTAIQKTTVTSRSISTNSLPQQRQPHKKIPQPIKKVSDRTKATDSLCRHYPILTPPFSDSRLSFLLFQLSRSLTCCFVIHPSERQKCFSDIRKPALSPVCTVLYEYCLTTTWWIAYRSVG